MVALCCAYMVRWKHHLLAMVAAKGFVAGVPTLALFLVFAFVLIGIVPAAFAWFVAVMEMFHCQFRSSSDG